MPPDPDTLEQVAAMSGGEFFTATDAEELERGLRGARSRLGTARRIREITDVFAGDRAALLLLAARLSAFWFRRVP